MFQSDRAKKIVASPAFLYIAILIGGAIGASLRYILLCLFPNQTFPQTTLFINFVGCYFIYLIYNWVGRHMHIPNAVVSGVGVGLIGAFTTLAAFNIECLVMLQNGQFALFAFYMAVTVFGTFLAGLAGLGTYILLARIRLHKLRERRRELHKRLAMQARSLEGDER